MKYTLPNGKNINIPDSEIKSHMANLQLTEEEAACIRWHMGAFTEDKDEWNYYNNAVKKHPNVLWTHTADMVAAKIQGI